ncbi:MAG: isochorismatase family protein [Fuerstiella sp.]|nr:isochorismatase family protein [Fuerstiella sp.]MCP4785470.1 isochorismatase family protein [Fuerstiella sp.]MCP4854710.1 isochorismatase family protein [Fuerstiella sp.]
MPVIHNADQIENRIVLLLDAAAALSVPVIVSEQYPKGLGASVDAIAQHQSPRRSFEKIRFSAAEEFQKLCASDDADTSVDRRRQVVIVGIEAHICVLQTAIDLLAQGYRVFVVDDAVSSRRDSDRRTAMNRLRDAGVVICSAESVVFEWCEKSGTDEFRVISRLVR